MEGNMEIREIMKLLHPLSVSGKLEIISRLTRELKSDIPTEKERKNKLLEELYGSWKDIDENIVGDIMSNRTISDKEVNFD
jgi:hypothetical protein